MITWLPIPGIPGIEASSDGRVRSSGRVLPGYVGPNGYRYHSIKQGGIRRVVTAHRLICRAFHGEPHSPEHEVAHANGNRLDNRPENLRWATRKENVGDMRRHGTLAVGERHGHAKLSEGDIRAIREMRSLGQTHQAIADLFGVNRPTITKVLNGQRWKHLALSPAT